MTAALRRRLAALETRAASARRTRLPVDLSELTDDELTWLERYLQAGASVDDLDGAGVAMAEAVATKLETAEAAP